MFCGSVTESLPRQVPHLPYCSYGLKYRTLWSCFHNTPERIAYYPWW